MTAELGSPRCFTDLIQAESCRREIYRLPLRDMNDIVKAAKFVPAVENVISGFKACS
jgi:hypothetical protein